MMLCVMFVLFYGSGTVSCHLKSKVTDLLHFVFLLKNQKCLVFTIVGVVAGHCGHVSFLYLIFFWLIIC